MCPAKKRTKNRLISQKNRSEAIRSSPLSQVSKYIVANVSRDSDFNSHPVDDMYSVTVK